VAALAAAQLAIDGSAPQLYTFAGPRVGNPAFAAQFDAAVPVHWRVANTEDIVTTVPLSTARIDAADAVKAPDLSILGVILKAVSGPEYQHVGDAVPFTVQRGSIVGNHDMVMYHDTVAAA
jgi:triacylglycerol lipase